MQNPLPFAFLVILSVLSPCLGVPETLELADGRKLESVTGAVMEEGKMKVTHSGGVMRISPADITPASRKALGIVGNADPAPVPEITRLETTKGEVYEDVRSVRVTPSAVSFVYRDGAASVGFDELPEETRARFGYDPAAAAAYEAKQAAESAAEEKAFDEELDKAESITAKKAAAIRHLKNTDYGGEKYWRGPVWIRKARDQGCLKMMIKAGYEEMAAKHILTDMAKAGSWAKPKWDPVLDQPWGQLRSSPDGFQKRGGIKKANPGGG